LKNVSNLFLSLSLLSGYLKLYHLIALSLIFFWVNPKKFIFLFLVAVVAAFLKSAIELFDLFSIIFFIFLSIVGFIDFECVL